MSQTHHLGQRVSFDGALCTVRYIGEVAGTTGTWLGVEWDDSSRGKHDGSHRGVRYFKCLSKSPHAASFVRPTRPAQEPQSFIAALQEKYGSEGTQRETRPADSKIIMFGTKAAQEMGFDKIRRKMAQLQELKMVLLDGMCIATAWAEGEPGIKETCPNITQLDLTRNLIESIDPVVEICRNLPKLRNLGLSTNRYQSLLSENSVSECREAFQGVSEMGLAETLLSWEDLSYVASRFPSLEIFNVGLNQLSHLPIVDYGSLENTLTTLNLEYNEFESIAALQSLTALTALRNLHLKGNSILQMAPEGTKAPIFPPALKYLDISYNDVQDWAFVDAVPTHFPGITGLRISHNPVYETPDPSSKASSSSTEEAHMFVIARIGALKTLNFTQISHSDRGNAEMFYLSRIAKQLAAVPESDEATVLENHPRYAEICEIYGAPDIIRRQEINPAFLESRLVAVNFHHEGVGSKTSKIPKSYDIYAVKGIAGKLFGIAPLELRLVWETGEWDPVAGYYDRDGDSSDEEVELEDVPERAGGDDNEQDSEDAGSKPGRWVKREVELKDGPRQLGYCVDGLDVTLRIEAN
ncbi:unnamed protein product [Clonostachys rosea f. rosea IK726]|uniref:CAP-Gly domain-containing protein n=2 Tax=Bionectria ochroleuca TaxID=29856 RepID=A0A0B7JUE8_BIOOC|nr:unnamed protein product [Clonostachys rosea f. rosea IK726]